MALSYADVMTIISENLCGAFTKMLEPLLNSIKEQTPSITNLTTQLAKQNSDMKDLQTKKDWLKHRLEHVESNLEVIKTNFDSRIYHIVQYARRTSIRFENVNKAHKITEIPPQTLRHYRTFPSKPPPTRINLNKIQTKTKGI